MSRFPGQSAVGSGGDAARGPVLGCVGLGVSWGLRRPLVAGLWRRGLPQGKRRQQVVWPPSSGAECSAPRWEARVYLSPLWLRPVVVRSWSPGDVVALAGSVVPLAWPHVRAGG